MPKVKLTDVSAIESKFAVSNYTDEIHWDTEVAGFGFRLRRGGKRTWVLQYKINGSDRRLTIGPYPGITPKAAREIAQSKLAEIWQGRDPQADKREAKARAQAQILLRTVIDNFLADKQAELRPSSFSEMQRYLLNHWKPLHGWPIAEIQLSHIAKILAELKKIGPVSAARSRSCLSTCFRWAMGNGYVQANPVIGSLNPDTGAMRDRVLNDSELATIWNACNSSDDYDRIIRLLILTGARRTEVGGMQWSELDFEQRLWTISADRSKNGNAHTLPLPPAFWQIIEGIEHRNNGNLFGQRSDRGYRNWDTSKKALDGRCPIPAWVHHDIRRSVATGLANLKVLPHIIEQILNHTSGHKSGVAGVYNKSVYMPEVRKALIKWAKHTASIVE